MELCYAWDFDTNLNGSCDYHRNSMAGQSLCHLPWLGQDTPHQGDTPHHTDTQPAIVHPRLRVKSIDWLFQKSQQFHVSQYYCMLCCASPSSPTGVSLQGVRWDMCVVQVGELPSLVCTNYIETSSNFSDWNCLLYFYSCVEGQWCFCFTNAFIDRRCFSYYSS